MNLFDSNKASDRTFAADDKSLVIVILAAGMSSRLGRPKQLVEMKQEGISISLLEYQCQQALKVTNKVICVLGAFFEGIRKHIEHLPVEIALNENWTQGMGSSIACGVEKAQSIFFDPVMRKNNLDKPAYQAVMIVLVDQWQLNSTDLNCVYQEWKKVPGSIFCAAEKNRTGPPVIFPTTFFPQLINLQATVSEATKKGAKSILEQNKSQVKNIKMPQAFVDLDTPEQLDFMQAEQQKKMVTLY
jgi:molybdenum cofactor cytidylyltransferase